MTAIQEKLMRVEEYAEHQLTCEGRHEYDNGHLYRVPDEMDIENLTASAFVYSMNHFANKAITYMHMPYVLPFQMNQNFTTRMFSLQKKPTRNTMNMCSMSRN